MSKEIVVEVWGDLACFTDPASKVERRSYPVPTPSAARGILSAIYSKPPEFYWQVKRIEVLNPIRYISFKRNEVKATVRKHRSTPMKNGPSGRPRPSGMCATALRPRFVPSLTFEGR